MFSQVSVRLFVVACWVLSAARVMAAPPPPPAAVGDDSGSLPVVGSSNTSSNVASAVPRLGSVFRRALSPQNSQTQHNICHEHDTAVIEIVPMGTVNM